MPVARRDWDAAHADLDETYLAVQPPYYYGDSSTDPADNGFVTLIGCQDYGHVMSAIDELDRWAEAHNIRLAVSAYDQVTGETGFNHPSGWAIMVTREYNPSWARGREGMECTFGCGATTDRFGWCTRCDQRNVCIRCQRADGEARMQVVSNPDGEEQYVGCDSCIPLCRPRDGSRCTNMAAVPDNTRPTGRWRHCWEHGTAGTCGGCEMLMDITSTTPHANGQTYCAACRDSLCDQCGTPNQNRVYDDSVGYLCPDCFRTHNEGRMERFDEDASMTPEELRIEALPSRPVRLISFEQEFMSPRGEREGSELARELNVLGFCWGEGLQGYHAGSHDYLCHVEHDSSVTGGELIYNRLNLATEEDSEAFATIMDRVRNRVRDGNIMFTLNCGGHIHVDLHGYTITDTRNLATMFGYIEDPIFRMAGSHYTDHRTVVFNDRYSAPILKGNWKSDREFGIEFLRNSGHSDALNLQHYYNAIRNYCNCGAMEFGTMEECTCVLPKCTAEWRVFNGTSNPRKMHAYIAFVQSLTAWCQQRELDPDDYPAMPLNPQARDFAEPYSTVQRRTIEGWQNRMAWVFQNLTFTDSERESLLYVIRNSALSHMGEDFIGTLTELERIPDERELTAPLVASRENAPNMARTRPGRDIPVSPRRSPDEDPYCGNCGEHYDDCGCDPF